MKNSIQFFKDSYKEISKNVTWLSWAQLQQYTIVIIIFMIIFALLIWVMDLGSTNGMRILYGILQ